MSPENNKGNIGNQRKFWISISLMFILFLNFQMFCPVDGYAWGDISIVGSSLDPDDGILKQHETLQFTVTIKNNLDSTETVTALLNYLPPGYDPDDFDQWITEDSENVTIGPDEDQNVTLSWFVGNVSVGTYRVSVDVVSPYVLDEDGDPLQFDNLHPGTAFNIHSVNALTTLSSYPKNVTKEMNPGESLISQTIDIINSGLFTAKNVYVDKTGDVASWITLSENYFGTIEPDQEVNVKIDFNIPDNKQSTGTKEGKLIILGENSNTIEIALSLKILEPDNNQTNPLITIDLGAIIVGVITVIFGSGYLIRKRIKK